MTDSQYRLSFTTGGLFSRESAMVAELYLREQDWELTRDKVRAENLLQVRAAAAALRISKEVVARLENLSKPEDQQKEHFQRIADACAAVGMLFTWEFDADSTIHARHIVTDHGWKILLDRGLDVFQRFEMNDAFDFANRLQQQRPCKAFEATFIRNRDA